MIRTVRHLPRKGPPREREEEIVEEIPLHVYVNGKKYATLLRTPGDDQALVVGTVLTEGFIREEGDILSVKSEGESVQVWTRQERPAVGTTLDEIQKRAFPFRKEVRLTAGQLREAFEKMESIQEIRRRTGASHGAMLLGSDLEPISWGEDVGRHNAFDKAIGKAFLEGRLAEASVAALSSRLSFEMVKKAAIVGLVVVVGGSRPTSMALLLAEKMGLTVASLVGTGEVLVYSGEERVRWEDGT